MRDGAHAPTQTPMTNPEAGERNSVGVGVLALVCFKLMLHVAAAVETPYEFHRDEFLYIAMGNHLQFLRMDFPPMIALLSEAVRRVAESSLFAYRLIPALAGTSVVWLAVLAVRAMGGGQRAQALTAIAVIFNPLFLRTSSLFQPVVLDQLWWMLGFYALVNIVNTEDRRWWILLGVACGLGLLSKFSILFFGAATLVGLLLTRPRAFLTPWPWCAFGVALLLGAPTVVGQVHLGFPLLDQMASLTHGQLDRVTFASFVGEQALWGPFALLFAGMGLVALLRDGFLARYSVLGWTALTAFVLFALTKGKSYYVGPIYPVLFAAAAAWIERMDHGARRAALSWGFPAMAILYGITTAPFGLPILPPELMARYAARSGVIAGVRTNRGELLTLPQDYADMLGWREKAEAVKAALEKLSREEQSGAVLYGANYGQAGSLEFYGRELRLPPVVSLAGSFYLFGPGNRPGRTLIILGVERSEVSGIACRVLEEVARVANRWGVPEERDVPILVCRDPNQTLQEYWRRQRPHWG